MAVPKRFGILRLVGTLLKVIAWIILVIAVIAAIVVGIAAPALETTVQPFLEGATQGIPLSLDGGNGIIVGIILLIVGLIYFLSLYAAGESILLRVALEENTRLTAALLLRMHQDSQIEAEPDYGGYGGGDMYQGR